MKKKMAMLLILLFIFEIFGVNWTSKQSYVWGAPDVNLHLYGTVNEGELTPFEVPAGNNMILQNIMRWIGSESEISNSNKNGAIFFWSIEEEGDYTLKYPLPDQRKVVFTFNYATEEYFYRIDDGEKVNFNTGEGQKEFGIGSERPENAQKIYFDTDDNRAYFAIMNQLDSGEVYPFHLQTPSKQSDKGWKYIMTGMDIYSRPTDWEVNKNGSTDPKDWTYKNKKQVQYTPKSGEDSEQTEDDTGLYGFQLYFNHPKLISIEGDEEWNNSTGMATVTEAVYEKMQIKFSTGITELLGNDNDPLLLDKDNLPAGLVHADNDQGLNPLDSNGQEYEYSINFVNEDIDKGLFIKPKNIDLLKKSDSYEEIEMSLDFLETQNDFKKGPVFLHTPFTYLDYEIKYMENVGYVLEINDQYNLPDEITYYVQVSKKPNRSLEDTYYYVEDGEGPKTDWSNKVTVDPENPYNLIDIDGDIEDDQEAVNAVYVTIEYYDPITDEKNTLNSQIYVFQIKDLPKDSVFTPTNVNIEEDDINVVPKLFQEQMEKEDFTTFLNNDIPAQVDFTVTWDIPQEGWENNEEVVYDIRLFANIEDYLEEIGEGIKNNSIRVLSFHTGYQSDKDYFEQVVELDADKWDHLHKLDTAKENNTYYLAVKVEKEGKEDYSLPKPINFENEAYSLIRKEIHLPGPDQIKVKALGDEVDSIVISGLEDKGNYSQFITLFGKNLEKTEDYYSLIDRNEEKEIEYEVFIGANQDALEKLQADQEENYNELRYGYENDEDLYQSLNITELGKVLSTEINPFTMNNTMDKSELEKNFYKDNEILKITVDPENEELEELGELTLTGLRPNQPHFVMVRAKLNMKYGANSDGERFYSDYINILTATTGSEEDSLEPGEQKPLQPEELTTDIDGDGETDVKESKVPLTWKYRSYDWINTEFEIIRLPEAMSDEMESSLDQGLTVSAVKDSDDSLIWRGIIEGEDFLIKNLKTGSTTTSNYEFISEESEKGIQLFFEDSSVRGNNRYFYYVRAIRSTDDSQDIPLMSDWVYIPVTTSRMLAPTLYDLKEFRESKIYYYDDNDYDDRYKLDKYEEALIYFTIPYGEDQANSYDFEIFVKGEEDTEYIKADGSPYDAEEVFYDGDIESIDPIPDTSTAFVYKISGLTHGTSYSIKVRMIDELQEIGDDVNAYSPDSDPITIRTEFDQDEYDEDQQEEEKEEELEKIIKDYIKSDYWKINDRKTDSYEVKLRSSYVSSSIGGYAKRNYELPVSQDDQKFTYYIPWENIEEANNYKISYVMEKEATQILLRPGTFTDEWILNYVSRKQNEKYATYYVMMKVEIIDGATNKFSVNPSGQEIHLGYELYGAKYSEREIEDRILEELNETNGLIEKAKESLRKRLNRSSTIDDDVLNTWVNEEFEEFKEDLADYVDEEFTSRRNLDKIIGLEQVQLPIMVQMKSNASSSFMKAYQYLGNQQYIPMTVVRTNDTVQVEVSTMGTYIFNSSVLVSQDQYEQEVLQVIAEYDLDSTLGYSHKPEDFITFGMVNQILAKVTQMPQGSNSMQWLRQIQLTSQNSAKVNGKVSRQEAVYLLMKLYGYYNHLNVDSIAISHYGAIADIGNVSKEYQRSLLAAYELNFIEVDSYGNYSPLEGMNIEEMLLILSKVLN